MMILIKPNFSQRALNTLPKINLPEDAPLILPVDAYLHPEFMRDSIHSYLERRRKQDAKISESTSE